MIVYKNAEGCAHTSTPFCILILFLSYSSNLRNAFGR